MYNPRYTQREHVHHLILQPKKEKPIRNVIEPHARPGRIELRAHRKVSTLAHEVRDNGTGMQEGEDFEEGVGLSNTRARLRGLYGEDHRFELRAATGGGLLIEMTIPFQA